MCYLISSLGQIIFVVIIPAYYYPIEALVEALPSENLKHLHISMVPCKLKMTASKGN